MSANTHTGEVSLRLGRKDYRLRYTWAALAQLRADFGQDYDAQISTAILEMNLK